MIFGQDRNELRRMYADAWRKRTEEQALTPLEAQIAAVIEEHPEYSAGTGRRSRQGLHGSGWRDQPVPAHGSAPRNSRTESPPTAPRASGLCFDDLAARLGDAHDAEHRMIDCLAEAIWTAQREQPPPDELQYLESLRKL